MKHRQNLFILFTTLIAIIVVAVVVVVVISLSDQQIVANETDELRGLEDAEEGQEPEFEYPLYLTTMTHMEGNWDWLLDIEDRFDGQVKRLEYGMDLAEEYGAVLTIESEQPFAEAQVKWGRNVMQEILDRGHGVGTHCDRGNRGDGTYEEFVEELKFVKSLVDDLVGEQNNLGCSGAGGPIDWAQALAEAGFSYVDGLVGFHMLAFPLSERPAGWDDLAIYSEHYHDNVPVDLQKRIHPIRLANTRDWEEDETGIVVSSGEMGQLTYFAEGDREDCIESDDCMLNKDDVDAAVALILDAAELHDTSRVAKLTFYFPTSDFVEENEEALRYFFSEMKRLEDAGVVQWASQLEVYEAFVQWEAAQ